MKLKILFSVLFILILSQKIVSQKTIYRRISYISGTIYEVSDNVIKLLDGSIWVTEYSSSSLPLTDIIIIYDGKNIFGTAFIDGDEISIKHLSGNVVLSSGYYTYVTKKYGEGAILVTEDGSYWEIPEYDRYYSGYWLPPYKVLITSNELYMYNLKENKKIWISRVEK